MERGAELPAGVAEGDVLLGLASDGVHSNGFSLVRRIVEIAGLDWDAPAPFADETLGAALLTPTRLYVRPALAAIRAGGVRGLAHITGGGLTENLPRVMPKGLTAEIDLTAILTEELALNLPLYPRAADTVTTSETFAAPGVEPMTDAEAKPFAGLAALRAKLGRTED